MVFLPFRNISTRTSLVAASMCVVFTIALYKLEDTEKKNYKKLSKSEDIPWRERKQIGARPDS